MKRWFSNGGVFGGMFSFFLLVIRGDAGDYEAQAQWG